MEFEFFNITRFFNPLRGNSDYTKEYGNKHKGKYPVYSASTNLPLTHTDHYDYDGEYLTWSTNGFGGFLKLLVGRFSINGDRGILMPRSNEVDIRYVQFILQPILREIAKGRKGEKNKNEFTKVSLSAIQEVEIPIPIKKDGTIDLEKQKEIAEKYIKIERIKNKLKQDYQKIEDMKVDINSKYEIKSTPFNEVFKLKKGNSKYTKKYVNSNKGKYPVYSANTKNNGILGHISSFDYDLECIQITTNGVHAGTIFYRPKHKFSINGDAKLLVKKSNEIDYEYLIYELRKIFRREKFGWENKVSDDKLFDLSLNFPVNGDGKFDLGKQKEIAKKHRKIEEIKVKLRDNYEKIANSEVKIIETND